MAKAFDKKVNDILQVLGEEEDAVREKLDAVPKYPDDASLTERLLRKKLRRLEEAWRAVHQLIR